MCNNRIKYKATVFLLLMIFGIGSLKAQWGENGVAICTTTGDQVDPQLISDGRGGAIITWCDRRSGNYESGNWDIYVQLINAGGNFQWEANGVAICTETGDQYDPQLISDGAGGAIITWVDERSGIVNKDIYAQRIDAGGNIQWTAGGVAVCTEMREQYDPQITSDGAGGAIITWYDERSISWDIYAQRIDFDGNVQWTAGGVAICIETGNQWAPQLISDGAGGAIITWEDARSVSWDIYAQKIDTGGGVQWTAGGVAICTETGDQYYPQLTSDRAGGAIFAWLCSRSGNEDIYAHRIDAGGSLKWTEGGVVICTETRGEYYPRLISDGTGGAIIAWYDQRSGNPDIYAQRIDTDGNFQWTPGGVAICTETGAQLNNQLTSDGAGGAIITWWDSRSEKGDIYAQRIDTGGSIQWTASGVAICIATGEQEDPQLTSDEMGGAIITWEDWSGWASDIYAQRTGLWGGLVSPWVTFPTTTAGDTSVTSLCMYNRFNEALTLRESSEMEGPFFFNQSFKDSISTGIIIEAGSYICTKVYFSPLGGGLQTRQVYFEDFDTCDTLAATRFQGEGRALSFDWATATLYPDRMVNIDDDLMIEEVMDDSVEVDSLVLYYAAGGSPFYQGKKMDLTYDDPVNDRYLGVLPASIGGPRGLHFYVAAFNGPAVAFNPSPESPERFRVRINNLSFDESQPASKYKMISFPVEIPNNTIVGVLEDDLGSQDAAEWRMFSYVPPSSLYIEIPNDSIADLEQGSAYWLITKHPVTLDTSPQEALSTPSDSFFVILLEPGWNMVGNPFNFTVAWDSCLVDTHTIAQADTILERPRYWSSSEGTYNDPIENLVTVLEPFEGYWVKNRTTSSVMLSIPPEEELDVPILETPKVLADFDTDLEEGYDWLLGIKVSARDARDIGNYVGIGRGTENHWDSNDCSEPPMSPGNAISLYFPHDTWEEHCGNYAVDIRGEYQALKSDQLGFAQSAKEVWGHLWRFDVAKNFSEGTAGDEVIIAFEDIGGVPAGAIIYLIDLELERLVDVRDEHRYRFFLGKKGYVTEDKARFTLIVGSEEFLEEREDELPEVPRVTVLYQNYPNPFNPATIIRYDVAEEGPVTLRIYDVRGAMVKTLYEGYRRAGRYEVGWDGDNEQGIQVASGIYFYRLKTARGTQTRKLILLK